MTTQPPVDNSGAAQPNGPKGPFVGHEPAEDRVQAALKEYLEQVDCGDAVDRDEFLAQRPEVAEELRSFIDAEEQLRKLAQPNERESTSTQSFAVHGQETIAPQGPARRPSEGSALKQQFGRYRIVRPLGKGAMGMVYLAEDTQLLRQVALKTPHFEQEPTPDLLERFYREARAAANLRHPNICPVHDVGQIEGTHYISMAFIDGHPLSAFIRAKPQPERQILIVVRKLAQALVEAHERGIVHRDLKPANIMVDKRNEPIIMDFGLARKLEREQSVRITQSGMLIGTPAYMSPEQIEGEPDKVGPASDQFSLGVILYELLTGQLPFRGSLSAVMAQIITRDPTPLSQLRPDLDLRIEALCQKMMAKDRGKRFPSLAAVAEEIAVILRNPGGKQTSTAELSGKPAEAAPPSDPSTLASSARQSAMKNTLAGQTPLASLAVKDLVSLEELARKCLARRDYDQVVQIIDRIPAKKRNPALNEILQTASEKADEIAYLVVEIDEAVRFKDRATALRKADELLKIKPGHHRALGVQQDFAGYGEGGLRVLQPFTRPWNEGGWIPYGALAFGLAVVGIVYGIIVIYLGKTAVVIDVTDPGISVAVKEVGKKIEIVTGPHESTIEVEAGEQELKITYAGLETRTKKFSVTKGTRPRVTVSIVDGNLVAKLDRETLPLIAESDKAGPGKAGEPAKNTIVSSPKQDLGKTSALADAGREKAPVKPPVPQPPLPQPPVPQRPKPAGLIAPFGESAARSARAQWANSLKQPGELTNKIGMRLRLIPPGTFLMGSTGSDPQQHPQQKPVHKVHISQPFYLGAFEVTRGEFAKFVAATGYQTEAEKDGGRAAGVGAKGDLTEQTNLNWRKPGFEQTDAHPVVIVSWNDASAFCRWLSEQEGQTYRLPSEAEWEYACRAGTLTPFFSGDKLNDLYSVGNGLDATFRKHFGMSNSAKDTDVRPSDGFVFTAPVGSFRANAFGLCDMHGNVWEWCQDIFSAPYGEAEVTDPTGPAEGSQRVTRGGAFDCGLSTTSATRDHIKPSDRYANIGFRVVCDPAPIPSAPEPPQSPAVAAAPGFVSLFNGRDLAGWQKDPVQPGDWHVEQGVLTGGGPSGASCLYSERADYKDFHLHIEARLTGDDSGAVCIRTQIPAADAKVRLPTTGYEVILREPEDPREPRAGTVYGLGSGPDGPTEIGFRRFDKTIVPGQWFTLDVFAEGRHTIVRFNGQVALDNHWIKKQYGPGRIALTQDSGKPSVEFRKIEIRELATAAELPVEKATIERGPVEKAPAAAAEFVSLFNGRDLSGWKTHESQPGGWRVEHETLIGDGPTRSHLYSERGDYRDFHLRVEAKINAGGNSGVFGRATYGPRWPLKTPQWPVGYEAQIYNGRGDAQTGSLYISDRGAAVVHVREALVPTGEWFTEELIVEGDRVVIKVNGKTTADYRDSRPIDQGHLGLQLHDSKTIVAFRKIEIRELGQSAPPPAGATPAGASPAGTPPAGTTHPDAPAILAAPFDESAATAIQQLWAAQLKAPIEATNSIGMHLRLIPPGEFKMGGRRHANEGPEHDVAITRPMYVGTYEITKGEFTKFASAMNFKTQAETISGAWVIEDTPKTRKWLSSKKHTFHDAGFAQDFSHPVVVVSWDDAQAFCAWLSQKEGRRYRLPTEAEWEYFCRAGTTAAAYSGHDEERLTTIGNVADATASQKFPTWTATRSSDAFLYTSPVGKFRANNFGLFDTIGNVTEWCADLYAADYYTNSPKNDPPGPAAGTKHVARGGSFTNVPSAVQRRNYTPDHRAFDCGFRVVCDIPANGSPPPFTSTTAVASPTGSGGRHLWQGPHSKFENRLGRSWHETVDREGVHKFVETSRKPEYIEMIDHSRGGKMGVRIRLLDNKALIIFPGRDKDWRELQTGQWEAAPKPRSTKAAASADNLLVNGSFEQGPPGLGDFMTFHPDSKLITGWVVTRATIDLNGMGRASDGQRSVDLHGSPGYGGIKQTFQTTPGQRYRVSFTLSCNPEARFKTKRIAVEVAGTTETFTVDGASTTWDKLRWDPHAFEFEATSEATTIEFHSLENRDPVRGPMIDDVRVTSLP
jgi:choice-of-anchor C domain-containing protein